MLTRLTNKLPGRTEPLVNPAINGDRWAECRRALRRHDQPRFDQHVRVRSRTRLCERVVEPSESTAAGTTQHRSRTGDHEKRIKAFERRLNGQNTDLQVLDEEASEPSQ